jgi:hypothetical protein
MVYMGCDRRETEETFLEEREKREDEPARKGTKRR